MGKCMISTPLSRTFEKKTKREGDCLLWMGVTDKDGYGTLTINGKFKRATHLAWFLATGNWPKKLILHKLECKNKDCVEYNHLYEGTQKENARDTILAGNNTKVNKTHCIRGHLFDEANTLFSVRVNGNLRRSCRKCYKIYNKKYYQILHS